MGRKLQAVIIDDAATYRKILNMVLDDIDGIETVGEFPNGKIGLIGVQQLQPDIVLLDVEMPEMNGLEVLKVVRQDFPDIGVIMVSGVDQRQADITIKALQLGAIDFVPKPSEKSIEENVEALKRKIAPLIHVFSTKKNLNKIRQITERMYSTDVRKKDDIAKQPVERSEITHKQVVLKEDIKALSHRIDLVVIGTSTGGPYALGELIPKLPADFPVPIVMVQHMPPNFTASLANSLSKKSNVVVVEAKEGDFLEPGKVYIAPGGHHMVLKKEGTGKERLFLGLEDSPPQHGCRPSVDVLFKSIADNYSGNVLAVIMTGMGSDGTDGVRALKKRNCYCLIQDEASCVVFGMPKVVYENKLADEVIPLNDLAKRITDIVKMSR